MNNPTNQNDQEIDLSQISKKIAEKYQGFLGIIFNCILFLKKNFLIFLALFIIGAVIGFFIDKSNKAYEHEIIVIPNFGSVDYLYSKINLIDSKIKENDTIFLKEIGIKNIKNLRKIEIEPIVDIYNFVNDKTHSVNNAQNTQNFELLKLFSESADINKVIEEELTSKNYPNHKILIVTNGVTVEDNVINPILDYLNDSDYYKNIQKIHYDNTKTKILKNNEIIAQIDSLIAKFSEFKANEKGDKLVYYHENTNLNGLIGAKNEFINEQGYHSMNLYSYEKIIKDRSRSVNVKISDGLNNKLKLVLPILFIFIFICLKLFISFYKNQILKSQK